ncbi:MAG: alpha/beta hydrolase [Pseudomonadaceae bacterium]|nr:alpha/beta hydrolase [Pseudomonadaceae bacterium]
MSANRSTGDALEFQVFNRRITAKRWGHKQGIPTFALHGWLDNANTFDRLAPLLPELDFVALDFAGHGLSDHRPPGQHYHPLTDIQDILAVAEQLGWREFSLLGHSMGAAIASELTATFPEKVVRAVFIDGLMATGGVTAQERLEQNRNAIESMLHADKKVPKIYPDLETMAQRVTQATDQSMAAALTLVQRGHKIVDGGVTWRTDPRIRFATPLRPTREQIDLLLKNSTAPSLLLVAEQGDTWYQGEINDASAAHPHLTIERMQGPHHIHLEPEHVDAVARYIRDFLDLDARSRERA